MIHILFLIICVNGIMEIAVLCLIFYMFLLYFHFVCHAIPMFSFWNFLDWLCLCNSVHIFHFLFLFLFFFYCFYFFSFCYQYFCFCLQIVGCKTYDSYWILLILAKSHWEYYRLESWCSIQSFSWWDRMRQCLVW